MVNVIILDNIKSNARQLENIIKNNVVDVRFDRTNNVEDFFEHLKSTNGNADIAFIDVELGDADRAGLQVAARLNREYPDIKIVFVSSKMYDNIEDIFDVNVFACLVKPYSADKPTDRTAVHIRKIFAKLIDLVNENMDKYVAIDIRGRTLKLMLSSIVSVESDRRKINIFLNNGTAIDMYMKLDKFCDKLPKKMFIRCHKSYCVNANYVSEMTNEAFHLQNGETVPISRSSQSAVKKEYASFLGDRLY